MAQFVIPLDGANGHFDCDVELSGTIYTLEFMWNTRAAFWAVSIKLFQAEDYLVAGEAMRSGWSLFRAHQNVDLPDGTLLVVDTGGSDIDPLQEDLGVRVILVYDDGE